MMARQMLPQSWWMWLFRPTPPEMYVTPVSELAARRAELLRVRSVLAMLDAEAEALRGPIDDEIHGEA